MITVARFAASDTELIGSILRSAYTLLDAADQFDNDGMDSESKLFLGDFIEALEECNRIEIISDEELLIDEA